MSENNSADPGTPGDDIIFGDDSVDKIVGTNGDDIIVAGGGDDELQGSAGDDTIFGQAGNDDIQGSGGADIIVGGTGDDDMKGAGGVDRFVFNFTTTNAGLVKVDAPEFADGTAQNDFRHDYEAWLTQMAKLYGKDVDGDGVFEWTWDQNASGVKITLEGFEGTYGDIDSVVLSNNRPRYYTSEIYVPGGEKIVSEDGHDTITGFVWGEDKLNLAGLDLDQAAFQASFDVIVEDFNGDDKLDTKLALTDGSWSVTLFNVSGKDEAAFFNEAISFEAAPEVPAIA